jgi:4-amino-4-deoxy-L-arabinose transferase-like glycosyltransferase
VVVAFVWVRRLYGARSAWLAAALLLVEPTIAAHTPVAALDVLAMEAVIIASYLVWRYLDQPAPARLVFAGVATAVAMNVKHTAIVLPGAFVVLALLHWFARPWWQGRSLRELAARIRPGFNALAAAAMVLVVSIWPLTLFDVSRPADAGRIFGIPYEPGFSLVDDVLHPAFSARWPAGIYIGSVFEAIQHGREGHSAFLWGEVRDNGWWYYFFAVALYKVPIGIALVMLLAVASLAWVRPKWGEVFILVPAVACGALICAGGINIGFRHALPAYGMLLLLASRCAAAATREPHAATETTRRTARAPLAFAWASVMIAAVHVASYHPDYLSYINAPWKRPWLAISDSNLDWGQTLKQLDRWLERHPQPPDRPIHFDSFDEPNDPAFTHYVRQARRLTIVAKNRLEPPTKGLLITCPSWLGGTYRRFDVYAHLREVDPVDTIGHALLVYDLDALNSKDK